MNRRFIVVTDLSIQSRNLLKFAVDWAEKAGAQVVVAHQASVLAPAMGDSEILSEIKKSHKQAALRELQDFTVQSLGHMRHIKFHVTTSKIETSLDVLNQSKQLDVIFTGIGRDKSFLERMLTENTAIKLSNNINKLIVSIPVHTTDFDFPSLCIALKQPYSINEHELSNLIAIAQSKFNDISLLSVIDTKHVNGEAETFLKSVSKKLSPDNPIPIEIIHSDDEQMALKNYIKNKPGCVLAIQKGPRTLLDIFRKYNVDGFVKEAETPLIIIPNMTE